MSDCLPTQGVKAEDVKQGALGDCWLVAAMATLAGTMPGAIKKLFGNSERSYRQARIGGVYTASLCSDEICDLSPLHTCEVLWQGGAGAVVTPLVHAGQ